MVNGCALTQHSSYVILSCFIITYPIYHPPPPFILSRHILPYLTLSYYSIVLFYPLSYLMLWYLILFYHYLSHLPYPLLILWPIPSYSSLPNPVLLSAILFSPPETGTGPRGCIYTRRRFRGSILVPSTRRETSTAGIWSAIVVNLRRPGESELRDLYRVMELWEYSNENVQSLCGYQTARM